MPISDALTSIMDDAEEIVASEALGLKADLETVAPVDTGAFRNAYKIEERGKMQWRISNRMEYASILFAGYRIVDGVARGSLQWVGGGDPMLEATNNSIERRLNRIKA